MKKNNQNGCEGGELGRQSLLFSSSSSFSSHDGQKKLSVFYLPFLLSLQILPIVVEVARVLPLVTFPLVYFMKGENSDNEMWVAIGVLLFFIMLGVLIFISILRTGNENPGILERLTRYGVAFVSTPKRVEMPK